MCKCATKIQKANPEFKCDKDLNTDATLQTLQETAKPSKFLPVHSNYDAYKWRHILVDNAAKSIDVQTFIWEEDESGAYIIERLIAAADRGVKIRLLVDDFLLKNWYRELVGTLPTSIPFGQKNDYKERSLAFFPQ